MSGIHPADDVGMGRVLAPPGVLPQAAHSLDPDAPLRGTEIAIDVESMNLDSASFRDLVENCPSPEAIRQEVLDIVATRGKMQNPRTGSGGMLVGRIQSMGPGAADGQFRIGDPVATLISLTATALAITDRLERWDGTSEVVPVDARAIVPSPRTICRLPDDMPTTLALSVLDVCGAPALTSRVLRRPLLDGAVRRLLLIGGGKSAVLASAAARRLGVHTQSAVPTVAEAERLRSFDVFDDVVVADASQPEQLRIASSRGDALADVTLVCVNVPGCEHSALLATREGGAVIYFSMATSFSAVALGAEAMCKDLDLYFGSGYVPGHAELALELVRSDARVRAFFDDVMRCHYQHK